MIPALRRPFNQAWTERRYRDVLARLGTATGATLEFPISETPCFFSQSFMDELSATGITLVRQILDNPAAMAAAAAAVPDRFRGPGVEAHPTFLQVDFGLARGSDGAIEPRLVELQAFASLYGFQPAVAAAYRDAFELPASLGIWLGGLDDGGYDEVMRRAVLNGHDPRHVVLMEIDPHSQKTWPDFVLTQQRWGVRAVDTSQVERDRRELFYDRDGVRTPIRRIYNRVIPDELATKGVSLPFDYRDDIDVEWAGHPSWYFRISKFSIPWLAHRAVPETMFLHQVDRAPSDRDRYLLKPLFSFAGGGIVFAPSDAQLAAIPAAERPNYILQERINFEPVIETPEGPTQAEIRIMYVWPQDGELQPVLPLIRMGRGKMMGVDYNRGLRWVGASAALIGPG
jgi:hypothetical protein